MNVAGKQSIKAIIQNFQFSDDEDEEEAEVGILIFLLFV